MHLGDKELLFFCFLFELRFITDKMRLLHGQSFLKMTGRFLILTHKEQQHWEEHAYLYFLKYPTIVYILSYCCQIFQLLLCFLGSLHTQFTGFVLNNKKFTSRKNSCKIFITQISKLIEGSSDLSLFAVSISLAAFSNYPNRKYVFERVKNTS